MPLFIKKCSLTMDKVYIFEKRELALKEGNGENTTYVQADNSTNNSIGNIGSAAQDAINSNPTSDSAIVNTNDFDGDVTDNIPTFAVNARKNGADVQHAITNAMKNPDMKKLGDVRFKVNFESKKQQKVMEMRRNAISFKKSELNEFLKTI